MSRRPVHLWCVSLLYFALDCKLYILGMPHNRVFIWYFMIRHKYLLFCCILGSWRYVLVNVVVFRKTFSYAGFEQQPNNKFLHPAILLLTLNYNWNLRRKMQRSGISVPIQSSPTCYRTEMCALHSLLMLLYMLFNVCLYCRLHMFETYLWGSDPLQCQSIVDSKRNIIYYKLDKFVKSGAKIVLSQVTIGDLVT